MSDTNEKPGERTANIDYFETSFANEETVSVKKETRLLKNYSEKIESGITIQVETSSSGKLTNEEETSDQIERTCVNVTRIENTKESTIKSEMRCQSEPTEVQELFIYTEISCDDMSDLSPPIPNPDDEASFNSSLSLSQSNFSQSCRDSPKSSVKGSPSKSKSKKILTALSPKSIIQGWHAELSNQSRYKYKPQRSSKAGLRISGDGDTWREIIAKHKTSGRIRSYFRSDLTGERVWDEPPSGASNIVLYRRSRA